MLRGVWGTESRRTVMAARAGWRRRRKRGLKKMAIVCEMRIVAVEYFGEVRCFQNVAVLNWLGFEFSHRLFLLGSRPLIVCYAKQQKHLTACLKQSCTARLSNAFLFKPREQVLFNTHQLPSVLCFPLTQPAFQFFKPWLHNSRFFAAIYRCPFPKNRRAGKFFSVFSSCHAPAAAEGALCTSLPG
jgi:hypothetical protein